MITYQPPTECPKCGGSNEVNESEYSAMCSECGHTVWPPGPGVVVVGLIRIDEEAEDGSVDCQYLLTRRAIDPRKGTYCFPCGFMIQGESWREALSREVYEETGGLIVPSHDWDQFGYDFTHGNQHALLFAIAIVRNPEDIAQVRLAVEKFQSTPEVDRLCFDDSLNFAEDEFSFPVHEEKYDEAAGYDPAFPGFPAEGYKWLPPRAYEICVQIQKDAENRVNTPEEVIREFCDLTGREYVPIPKFDENDRIALKAKMTQLLSSKEE